MWVSKKLKELDFPFDFSNDIKAFNLLPVQDLDGNFVPSYVMLCNCKEIRLKQHTADDTK